MPSIDVPAIDVTKKQQSVEPVAPRNEDRPAGSPVESGNPGGVDIAPHDVPTTPATNPRFPRRLPKTPARTAANRANGKKSTGPRTEKGKRRVSRNLPDPRASRLMGLVEAQVFNQQPGAAEKLYREITGPYEPVPPLLAMHFHDLARLHLELEAWERIRDAQIEERWRQSQIELRRNLHNLQRDLPSTTEETFEKGLAGLPESPARAKHQVQCLWMLRRHLDIQDFDFEPILHKLYGKALNPASDRAQTICIRCNKLMHPEEYEPLSDEQYDVLIGLVALEQQEAVSAYGLYLDDASLPESARLANLGPTKKSRAMALEGTRLRQAIDRKQWVITGLLQAMGLGRLDDYGSMDRSARPRDPLPPSKMSRPKPLNRLASTKRPRRKPKSGVAKATRPKLRG